MMKSPVEMFLSEIEAFLVQSGMSASAFGREALNDPSFVFDVRVGRMPNLGLVKRVQDFMSDRLEKAS